MNSGRTIYNFAHMISAHSALSMELSITCPSLLFLLICAGDSASMGYPSCVMPRPDYSTHNVKCKIIYPNKTCLPLSDNLQLDKASK